jgi:pyridoxine 4-dehydrogenase
MALARPIASRQMGSVRVSAVGLGCMPLSIENNRGEEEGIRTIHAALNAGCRLLDTAWSYYESGKEPEANERLIRQALDTWDGPREDVLVATKVGHYRNFTDGKPTWAVDGRPETLIREAKQSAQALGVDSIDLLYFHRPDPSVPYEESVGAIKELVDQGVAKMAGVSNASVQQIHQARDILGSHLVAVQNEYSPVHRSTQDTLDECEKLGLAFVCYSPLGGYRRPVDQSKFDVFKKVAAVHSVSYQQVELAWELAQGSHVITIPGAHRPETILDSLKAADLQLSDDEIAELNRG